MSLFVGEMICCSVVKEKSFLLFYNFGHPMYALKFKFKKGDVGTCNCLTYVRCEL